MFDVDRALVLFGELQQLFACLGEAGDDEGVAFLAGREVYAAAHAHDGVEGGANGAGEGAVVLDNVGVAQASAAAEEFETRSLVFHKRRPVGLLLFVGVLDGP